MATRPMSALFNAYPRQASLFVPLLVFRWVSLLPVVGLFLTTPQNGFDATLLVLAWGVTFILTVFHYPFSYHVFEVPLLTGLDLVFMAILLSLSGAGDSPYTFHAFSPLFARACFSSRRGIIITTSIFVSLYATVLLTQQYVYGLTLNLHSLVPQLSGLAFVPVLLGYFLARLEYLRYTHQILTLQCNTLSQNHTQLRHTYHQLEVMHELTLFLQGAPDNQSVQHRLLKAVTGDLGFSQAVLALVNPTLNRLESWHAEPSLKGKAQIDSILPLTAESGLIAQVVLSQQVGWSSAGEPLVDDEVLALWLAHHTWVVLPVTWQRQTVGVLLVSVVSAGPVDMHEDRWIILTTLVSQAAMALSTIHRTRHLAIEQERNRIARDIHDTVAQSLFGIVFSLDASIKVLPEHPHLVKQDLTELRAVANQVRQEVRQSILDIWPSDLTRDKFKNDLSNYVLQVAPDQNLQVGFKLEGDFDGLPTLIRRSLYRVSQEALSNVAQHAHTNAARVYLYVAPEEVYLSVKDKGCGFDPKAALNRAHNPEKFGLRGMRERIQELGGTCDILSQIGHGTQIQIHVPLNGRNGHG